MKNRALRRSRTSQKASRRYNLYHGDRSRDHDNQVAFGLVPKDVSPHVYHKRKGCECRGCSSAKKTAKIKAHEAARTEAKKITRQTE